MTRNQFPRTSAPSPGARGVKQSAIVLFQIVNAYGRAVDLFCVDAEFENCLGQREGSEEWLTGTSRPSWGNVSIVSWDDETRTHTQQFSQMGLQLLARPRS